jgi:predicted regulator of Ras-like GTPase activity (Roadblock/LC7/MglB family)
MIDQILIMSSGGIPLFTWTPLKSFSSQSDEEKFEDNKSTEENLLSGFFTALNMFAEGQKGEEIKEITLKETTYIVEKTNQILFVISTKDNSYINLIKLLIDEIKAQFFIKYPNAEAEFTGNIKIFSEFNQILNDILISFNYFDILNFTGDFFKERLIKAIFLIDRKNGKPLFVKAQEYSDREILTFQVEIILRAGERLLKLFQDDKIENIVALSQKYRSLIIKPTTRTILIVESLANQPKNQLLTPITPKQLKKRLKSPGKLLFESDEAFYLIDQMGNLILSNNNKIDDEKKQLGIELVPIRSAIEEIFKNIYRDSLFHLLIVGENNDYLQFNLHDHMSLIVITQEKCGTISDVIEDVVSYRDPTKNKEDIWKFNCIFNRLHEFYEKF